MNSSLRDPEVTLARLCRRIGWRKPTWVQGAGGTVSLKCVRQGRSVILIKASGVTLDQVTPTQGFATLDVTSFLTCFDLVGSPRGKRKSISIDLAADSLYSDALLESQASLGSHDDASRPSLDTGVHIAHSSPLVATFHSVPAILMGHHLHQDRRLKSWLEHEMGGEVAYLPPMMPGRELAHATFAHRQAKVIVVANYGVILGLDHPRDIALWEKTEKSFLKKHAYQDVLSMWTEGHRADLTAFIKSEPIPIKYYMPDAAVFADDIQKSLISSLTREGEKHFTLSSPRRDIIELWAAQKILFMACPQLSSLPHSLVAKIRKLSGEVIRENRSAS